jgi:hypothetical protein
MRHAVAAFPGDGPLDVIADPPIGALDQDLRAPALRALEMSRESLPEFRAGAFLGKQRRQFLGNLTALQPTRRCGRCAALPAEAPCKANRTLGQQGKLTWQKSSSS